MTTAQVDQPLCAECPASDLAEHHATVLDPGGDTPRQVTYWPYRGGLVLLGALVAFPALGPAFLLHLHHAASDRPELTWAEHLRTLRLVNAGGRFANDAVPSMTAVQAQEWQALLDGLHRVADRAAEHNLALPEPITAWAQWVVPVGRLSFPAGRIVNTLDRQRPLMPDVDLAQAHVERNGLPGAAAAK